MIFIDPSIWFFNQLLSIPPSHVKVSILSYSLFFLSQLYVLYNSIYHRLNLLLIQFRRILEHGGQRFASISVVLLINQVVMRVLCILIISCMMIRKTMKQFEFVLMLYTCFLFLLRGDLFTLFYVFMFFCFGMITPVSLSNRFVSFMTIALTCIIGLRYLVQTPLVCQSTGLNNGRWYLSFNAMCNAKLVPDSFQPLFVFSLYKNDSRLHPPRGSSLVWDVVLLLLYFSYHIFLSVYLVVLSHCVDVWY